MYILINLSLMIQYYSTCHFHLIIIDMCIIMNCSQSNIDFGHLTDDSIVLSASNSRSRNSSLFTIVANTIVHFGQLSWTVVYLRIYISSDILYAISQKQPD